MVTDQNPNIIARHDYLPFGEEIPGNTAGRDSTFGASDNVNQKFTGQERDAETGLDFFHARYYTSGVMRFMSPDPANAGADLTNPQSWNGYSYVLNNPLNAVDPDGMGLFSAIGNFFSNLFGGESAAPDGDGAWSSGGGFYFTPVQAAYGDGSSGAGGGEGSFSFRPIGVSGGGQQQPSPPPRQGVPIQPPKAGTCIPPQALYASDATNVIKNTYLLTKILSRLIGKTVGFGLSTSFGVGIGGDKFSLGAQGGGFATIATDRNGNSAIMTGDQFQGPTLLQTMKGSGGLAFAANIGIQAAVTSQTIGQMSGSTISLSGAYGPVAVDANAHGGAVTYGLGAGARFSVGPSISTAAVIPICGN
jgi:RHS repeat-associated protein